MNVAEWIIVGILSTTLFIFLILGIILFVKLIKLTNRANKVVETGQRVADRASGFVDGLRGAGAAAVSSIVNLITSKYNKSKESTSKKGEKDDK